MSAIKQMKVHVFTTSVVLSLLHIVAGASWSLQSTHFSILASYKVDTELLGFREKAVILQQDGHDQIFTISGGIDGLITKFNVSDKSVSQWVYTNSHNLDIYTSSLNNVLLIITAQTNGLQLIIYSVDNLLKDPFVILLAQGADVTRGLTSTFNDATEV